MTHTNRMFIKLMMVAMLSWSTIRLLAENGYDVWLRYHLVSNPSRLAQYQQQFASIAFSGSSPSIMAARKELELGLSGLLQKKCRLLAIPSSQTGVLIGLDTARCMRTAALNKDSLAKMGHEGFYLTTQKKKDHSVIILTAKTETGLLYGVFHLLRLMQTEQRIEKWQVVSSPKIRWRMLNHWDNLNGSVERGYAGHSIWNWNQLPDTLDPRYADYARVNASIGINATVLNNVNANSQILTADYLKKVAALASIFRPYGIKVFLSARFSAPMENGGLKTADPLNKEVIQWWTNKAKEIYTLIPDFGGFLVKANSEGQPGPQDYHRNHADGANMLADAVAPYHGIIIWRAFVYSAQSKDRFKQAYEEFKPLDGLFRSNVSVQVKNGPIDFQPREPFSPLFGQMPKTQLAMEFQVTQEYLGQSQHLVFEAPLFKEVLSAETFVKNGKGRNSRVSGIIDGSYYGQAITVMAGVANIGSDTNWCGHPFAQANWYALGRLAWDHELSSEQIAEEWIRQTYSNEPALIEPVKKIMLSSRETLVNYMTPLGLAHIMYNNHHHGPMPWGNTLGRPDWNPVYYHRADSTGIGFDRTIKGSNALEQYAPEIQQSWGDSSRCPDSLLLWFHHVSWNHIMQSKKTLWNDLCDHYYSGTTMVKKYQTEWASLKKYVDAARFQYVSDLLDLQVKEAIWWRNACLLYFQTFSKLPIHQEYEQPDHSLDYYRNFRYPYKPGNK